MLYRQAFWIDFGLGGLACTNDRLMNGEYAETIIGSKSQDSLSGGKKKATMFFRDPSGNALNSLSRSVTGFCNLIDCFNEALYGFQTYLIFAMDFDPFNTIYCIDAISC